jgi:GntR family transcriptional repressor for pyruvate dehydrogenase complex
MPTSSPRKFAVATPPRKAARAIADVVIEHIISGGYAPGDFLPSTDAMCEHFSASKPTVREALHLVEGEGFVRMRRGPGGGAEVIAPDASELIHGISRALRAEQVLAEDAYALLFQLLPMAARYATTRATAAQVAGMAEYVELIRETGEDENIADAVLRFHQALADICGNPPLSAFATILIELTSARDPIWIATDAERSQLVAELSGIYEAIASGQVDSALALTSRHLASTVVFNPARKKVAASPKPGRGRRMPAAPTLLAKS